MNATLTRSGLELPIEAIKAKFGQSGYKTLLNKFTIRIKSPVGQYYLSKKIYDISGKTIIFPRFSYKSLEKIIKTVSICLQEGHPLPLEYIGEPTHNQKVVADHLSQVYSRGALESGATVKMIAGSGKSFLAMEMINRLKTKTIVVVPNVYLLQQWESILSEFFPGIEIGVYYGKKKRDGDIVVAVINSLCSENDELVPYTSKFGFMILDESHMYCTDKFKKVFKLQCRYMLGLSATPNEREDKTDIISHLNAGKLIDAETIEGYRPSEVSFEAEVKIIKYKGPKDHTNIISEATGMVSIPPMIDMICSDEYRNSMIIREITHLLSITDMNVFVFSDRRSHCELLEEMLGEAANESQVTMYGGCSKDIIKQAIDSARVIFTTYAYSSTGVSIEKLTGLVLATPRKSKARQIIGRIFRNKKKFIDKKRYIVDIVDTNSCFSQQLYKRMPAYKERDAEISFICETSCFS